MRLVYCDACHHVSLKSRLERNRCERCGREAGVVRVPYPWQYAAGAAIVVFGTVFLVLPQVFGGIPWSGLMATLAMRLVWLFLFLGVGLYLSNRGVHIMKERALAKARELSREAGV